MTASAKYALPPAVALLAVVWSAAAAAQPAVEGGARSGGQPPRIESADSLDPLSIEGSAGQRAGAPARNTNADEAAAQRGADKSVEDDNRNEEEATDLIDLDALKQRLLEEGSSAQREQEPAPPVPGQKVVLRGLDKMTGALGETEASVGETAKLWRLEIDVKACFSRVEASQSAAGSAFVQIRDTKNGGEEQVFSGWMFAASPALSAMDHPRYDVWVLSCKTS